MYRTLLGIVAVFAAALALVGLTFSASVEAPADFRFINGTEPTTLDPQRMTGQPEGRVADAVFEGLTRRDARTLRPVPGVAESWEISPDGRRYVFHLREDARWSDGQPVTADDFAYAWRRLQDPALGAEYAYILHMVRFAAAFNTYGGQAEALRDRVLPALDELAARHASGVPAPAWHDFVVEQGLNDLIQGTPDRSLRARVEDASSDLVVGELPALRRALDAEAARRAAVFAEAERRFGVDAGVYARDPRTLVVELVAPTPYFLDLTSFYPSYPAPRWVIEREGNQRDWFLPGKIVSNGPFLLESWRVNDKIRLARNPRYWGRDEVALERVDVLPIENATTALSLYLTGEVDWLPQIYPKDLVDQLRLRPDFYKGPGMIVYYYRFNTRKPPFDDPRVRKAINLAIDREMIAEEILALGEIPAAHLVPPGMPGYRAPESAIRSDIEEARRLLAEAGHPGGQGIPELGILYNTSEGHKKIAELIADQLRTALGLEVRAYNQEWQSYLATVAAGDYQMARAGWVGDYQDPNTFLDLWVTGGGNNQTGWSHPLYDRLIAAAEDVEGFAREPDFALGALREPEDARRLLGRLAAARGAEARREAAARLRMQLLREAEAILVQDEFPIMPIYFYVVSGMVKPRVEGFYAELEQEDGSKAANLQDLHPLRAIRVRPEPGAAKAADRGREAPARPASGAS